MTTGGAVTTGMAAAYSASGDAWGRGPALIYDRLAKVVVARCPVPLGGRHALDLGAGTGAAARALAALGARVTAADAAAGMLAAWPGDRPPVVVADALDLPFAGGSFDAVVAAFSLTHLTDPATGLREAARVTRPGGAVIASSYAADDDHPAKEAVEAAAGELGWTPPAWYQEVRAAANTKMADPEAVAAVAEAAGLAQATVHRCVVDFGVLPPTTLVRWRLGLAQLAPFAAALDLAGATRLERRALEVLGADPPPLRRPTLILTAVIP